MARRDGDDAVDIAVLSQRMQGDVANLRVLPRDCSIYRVPERLRRGHETVFEPLVVSIGPYHYGKQQLRPMEEHKRRFSDDFCRRTQVSRIGCLTLVEQRRDRLRNSYAEETYNPIIGNGGFVEMIFVDASFIIELFLRLYTAPLPNMQGIADQVTRKPAKTVDVFHDLILLENQLPFFVLVDLFSLACPNLRRPDRQQLSMIHLAQCFCQIVWDPLQAVEPLFRDDVPPNHLLDVLRISHVSPAPAAAPAREPGPVPPAQANVRASYNRIMRIRTATELQLAGIRFRVSPSRNLFQINFQNGVLVIPKLKLTKYTETVLRNVMVLEQLEAEAPSFINQYLVLLNLLLRDPKDVELLIKHDIVETIWEPERVSALFHNILPDYDVDFHPVMIFSDLLLDLGNYYYYRTDVPIWRQTSIHPPRN